MSSNIDYLYKIFIRKKTSFTQNRRESVMLRILESSYQINVEKEEFLKASNLIRWNGLPLSIQHVKCYQISLSNFG